MADDFLVVNAQGSTGPTEPPRACLRSESGHLVELLPNRMYVMGRGEQCDIKVDDQGCSRRHVQISVSGDCQTLTVEDLGSKNFTFVNGARIDGRVQLHAGDQIRVGQSTFLVQVRSDAVGNKLDTRTTLYGGALPN